MAMGGWAWSVCVNNVVGCLGVVSVWPQCQWVDQRGLGVATMAMDGWA